MQLLQLLLAGGTDDQPQGLEAAVLAVLYHQLVRIQRRIVATDHLQHLFQHTLGTIADHLDRIITGKLDLGRVRGLVAHLAYPSVEQAVEEQTDAVPQATEQTGAFYVSRATSRPGGPTSSPRFPFP